MKNLKQTKIWKVLSTGTLIVCWDVFIYKKHFLLEDFPFKNKRIIGFWVCFSWAIYCFPYLNSLFVYLILSALFLQH